MATAARDLTRLRLPNRIQTKPAGPDSLSARLQLADRIADLPGVRAEDHDATLPCSVEVFLSKAADPSRRRDPDILLCTISNEGIWVYGLDDWDRHQILLHRWGKLRSSGVLLYLPRDGDELEICWLILQRAHRRLADLSNRNRSLQAPGNGDLPRFSRTSLQ